MDVRERIINKATDLFYRYGIRRVTMDEMAAQLGISKKTIYQVFADKNELVDAITNDHIVRNCTRCEMDKQKAHNAIHEIFLAIDMIEEMFSTMNPTIIYDLQKFHPGSYSRLNQFKQTYLYQVMNENLDWGLKDGLYRNDMHKEVLVKLRMYTLFLPLDQEIFPHQKYNVAEVEYELLNHFLHGIATIKGLKVIEKYKKERQLKTIK